jgi:hypothetical protein
VKTKNPDWRPESEIEARLSPPLKLNRSYAPHPERARRVRRRVRDADRHLVGSAEGGIGFFDYLHGQTGVAPNGIELHPVLRFANATCTSR